MIDERIAMGRHKAGYMATGGLGAVNSGLKRIDLETGQTQVFDFGDMTQVGEPVFAARPGGDLDQGWLLVQCLGPSKTSTSRCSTRRQWMRGRLPASGWSTRPDLVPRRVVGGGLSLPRVRAI